jgi:uncharacterized glyoxalase superfamily protein PhnB
METVTPNLMVNDVKETIAYYEKHFDFKVAMSVPEEGQFDWAMVSAGNVNLMFQLKETLVKDVPALAGQDPGGSLTLFVQVKGVDELRARLSSEVQIVVDLETKFYGMREFTIQDLNGYYLTFAERVE